MIESIFQSLAVLVPAIIIATAFINEKLTKTLSSGARQATSWIVAMVFAFAGYWKQIGMFEDLTVLQTGLAGLLSAFAANSIFDITFVQSLFDFLKKK